MAQNKPYWNNISDFERGWNMTRSWAVNGWMAGYLAENILWLVSSFFLVLGQCCESSFQWNSLKYVACCSNGFIDYFLFVINLHIFFLRKELVRIRIVRYSPHMVLFPDPFIYNISKSFWIRHCYLFVFSSSESSWPIRSSLFFFLLFHNIVWFCFLALFAYFLCSNSGIV